MDSKPVRLDVYRTAIAMRRFEHAAATRDLCKAVVVRLELADGRCGWGETLPRDYVTGETIDSVVADLRDVIWPAVVTDASAPLPERIGGAIVNAAACAMELAMIDAAGQWPELPSLDAPIVPRVSGVLGAADPARTARQLRLMRWFGLRDFKLKLGLGEDIDAENLRAVAGRIGGAVAAGKCTLRVDVNGAWDADSTPDRVRRLKSYGVCVVEQPVFGPAGQFVELARRCDLLLMADESLVTQADARELLAEPKRIAWNVRISKNGGLTRSLALLRLAAEHGVTVSAGCMVGESSILSAAQRRLLQAAPRVRFVEGNYGRFLLAGDLVRRPIRFGYGGRLRPLKLPGLGVRVDPARVGRRGDLLAALSV